MNDVLSWIRLSGPFLVGHRGFPGMARENTPQSFEAALEAGCDGVELDVHLTRDGVPVVHHDETAQTEAGPLTLGDTEWPALAETTFQSGADRYAVSSLDEVLGGLDGRALINVEIKPPRPERRRETADRVMEVVSRVRPRESVLVSSFDHAMLTAVRDVDRGILLGFLFSAIKDFNHLEEIELVDQIAAIHPRHDLVDSRLMKRAGERGFAVHTWTVDDPHLTSQLVSLGVTSVISNRPDLMESSLFSAEP